MTTTTTLTDRISDCEARMARLEQLQHPEAVRLLEAAAAFQLADLALGEAEQQAEYYAAADAYSSALDRLLDAAMAIEVER